MPKTVIPRGVRTLACGCYIMRQKGKFVGVITCKEHTFRTLVSNVKPRKRKRALD